MLKKLSILLLALVLTLSFVACSSDKSTDDGEKDTTSKTKDAKDLPTVVWYNIGDAPADLPSVNKRLSDLVRDRIGANVEIRHIGYGDYTAKIGTMLAAGDDMDMVFAANWAANFTQNALDGYFVDLNTLKEYMPETIDLVNPALKTGASFDGALYGISTNKEVGWDNYIFIVEEEVAFLDSGDVKVPLTNANKIAADGSATEVTFAEYIVQDRIHAIAPELRIKDFVHPLVHAAVDAYRALGVTVVNGNTNLNDPNYVTVYQASAKTALADIVGGFDAIPEAQNFIGINAFDKNASEYKMLVDTSHPLYEAAKETARSLDTLIKSGDVRVFNTNDTAFNGKDHRFLFETRAAFPYWGVQLTNDYSSEGNTKTISQYSFVPAWTGGSDPGVVTAIPVHSKNKEETAKFIELVNTDQEVRTTVAYGVEGVHWNYVDHTDDITGNSYTAADKLYFERTEKGKSDYAVGVYTQGNFFVLPLQKGEPANKWEVFLANYTPNTTGKLPFEGLNFSASSGFRLDLTSPDMQSAVAAFASEYEKYNLFFLDNADFEEKWAELEALKEDNNGQKLVEEINKQYKEFLANK